MMEPQVAAEAENAAGPGRPDQAAA